VNERNPLAFGFSRTASRTKERMYDGIPVPFILSAISSLSLSLSLKCDTVVRYRYCLIHRVPIHPRSSSVHVDVCRMGISLVPAFSKNRKMLILRSTTVQSNEILVFGCCCLTGIERDLTYEGR
jgi:hypothetical protein